ncbi:MAG: AraC family transcriptional regulator [Pseudacidovorax sp.]|nr:AraC family transcriptional regulator [Pseudacidovorax sp.]
MVDFIQLEGGDADRILGSAGLCPEHLSDTARRIDLKQYCSVFEEAARQTGDDNFGLHYGRQFKPDALGMLGYVGMSSATVGEALRNMARVFPYHQQGSLFQLVDAGEFFRLDYQVRHGGIVRKRHDAELSLCMFLNLMRHALGPEWAPEQVHLENPRPASWNEHRKVFSAPVLFEQEMNSLVFRKGMLDCPMPSRDSRLLALLIDNMRQSTLQSLPGEETAEQCLVDEVKAQIQRMIGDGEPTMEQVANGLRIPVWTLQRRLSEQHQNFTALVEEMRRELATYYLRQSSVPLSEVALMLGYSESSAFSRAFRRWFGSSPRQWRDAGISHDGRASTH